MVKKTKRDLKSENKNIAIFFLIITLIVVILFYESEKMDLENKINQKLYKISQLNNEIYYLNNITQSKNNLIEFLENNIVDLQEEINRNAMYYYEDYGLNISNKGKINGVAFTNEAFFCVWTENRKLINVLETCGHEYAHLNYDMTHGIDYRNLITKYNQLI